MAICVPFKHVLSTSSSSTAFTDQNATTTEPSGDAVIDLLARSNGWGGGHKVPTHLLLLPYGTDADTETFDVRVYGYNKTEDATPVYVPILLVDFSVALTARTATAFGANTFLADTITVNDGWPASSVWASVMSSAEDMSSGLIIHTLGCQYIKFDFDMILAATGNCLVRPLSVD